MSFIFTCPSCRESLTGEEKYEGGESVCPLCSAAIVIRRDLGVDEPSSKPAPTPKREDTIKAPELVCDRGRTADFFSNVTKSSRLMVSLAMLQLRGFYEKWFRLVPDLRAIGISLIQQGRVTLVSQKLAQEVNSISSKISDDYAKEEEMSLSECLGWKEKVRGVCRRVFFRLRIVTFSLLRHVKAVAIGEGVVSSSPAQGIANEQINRARAIKEGIDLLKEEARQVQLSLPLPLRQPLLVVAVTGLFILAAIGSREDSRKESSRTRSSEPSNYSSTSSTQSSSGQSRRHLSASLKSWTEQTLAGTSLSEESKTVLINSAMDTANNVSMFEGGNRDERYQQALHEKMKLLGIRPR
jgi:uncharacterized protein YbaR (Trm112 family)